jgi:hypothetical protein
MQSCTALQNNQILKDPLAAEITRELEANHARELRRLSDLAFVFLNATAGDRAQAESLLDDTIDLLFEGGALSMWRYRIILAAIREGL